jgi:hypothetical protein
VGTGTKEESQLLGAFELLDLTLLRPVLAWRVLKLISSIFKFYFPGRGKPWLLNQ